jgi:dienelactone hydrolase
MTEIWYPATDDSRDLPKNRLLEFFLKNQTPEFNLLLAMAFGVDITAADARFQNFAVRDARVRDGVYPLLLFSHGNGGLRMQNAFWCEHMASHGYIVMSPDHTGNCAVTFVDGKMVLFQDKEDARKQSSVDRPKDLSFLIDCMDRMNKGGDSRFFQRVDMERIGAAGHSFGGYTCTWITNQEPRVRAVAPMAGAAPERTNYDCPIMLLIATEDDTLGADKVAYLRRYYDESKGPHYSIEFKNAGHYSFTEMYQLKPDFGDGTGEGKRITNGEPITYIPMETAHTLTNGYTTAFFGKYLKGIDGYDAYLSVNHNPDELIVQSAP